MMPVAPIANTDTRFRSLSPTDKLCAEAYPLVAGLLHKPLDKNKIQQIRGHATLAM